MRVSRCGSVDPAPDYRPVGYRHECSPTAVQAMRIGVDAVEQIGRSLRDAFARLVERKP